MEYISSILLEYGIFQEDGFSYVLLTEEEFRDLKKDTKFRKTLKKEYYEKF